MKKERTQTTNDSSQISATKSLSEPPALPGAGRRTPLRQNVPGARRTVARSTAQRKPLLVCRANLRAGEARDLGSVETDDTPVLGRQTERDRSEDRARKRRRDRRARRRRL